MKNILILLIATATPTYAGVYKCTVDGQTAYQSSPCADSGESFKIKKEISVNQQKAAQARLDKEMADNTERHRQARIANDRERVIRAEENKAHASYLNARESARQADELHIRNRIEANKPRPSRY